MKWNDRRAQNRPPLSKVVKQYMQKYQINVNVSVIGGLGGGGEGRGLSKIFIWQCTVCGLTEAGVYFLGIGD